MGSPCRSVFTFILILISLTRPQKSKQDLIGSFLLNKLAYVLPYLPPQGEMEVRVTLPPFHLSGEGTATHRLVPSLPFQLGGYSYM